MYLKNGTKVKTNAYIVIVIFFVLTGCTAPRRLARKFSAKPAAVVTQLDGEGYANKPAEMPARYMATRSPLWQALSAYSLQQDSVPPVPDQAIVRLSLTGSNVLTVSAFDNDRFLGSFDVAVRKRGNYLILKKERRMIPIPVIYFRVEEEIIILSPLENNRIGFYHYTDETLWILFFGASKTGRSMGEYIRVDDGEKPIK